MRADRNQFNKAIGGILLAFLCAVFAASPASRAQTAPAQQKEEPYIIGNSDRLSISFWQKPDLNKDVKVNENGTITLPVIGDIKAAGLTTAELARKIVEQMSFYNTPVSQATVVVTEFNSRSVVVTGKVVTPKTLAYERIPDVWKVILDAGGPTDDADLSRVTIVRKENEKTQVIDVDLYKIIKEGDLSKAPSLRPGDLVNVPGSSFGTAMQLPSEPRAELKNIYFVYGAVTNQGPRNLEPGIDVLEGITLAGGTTAEADLKNVRLVMKDAVFSSVVKLNLEQYYKNGNPPRLTLHPEDTIVVPAKGGGAFMKVVNSLGTIAPTLGAMGTFVLLFRR